jgi:hypothetical protein
MPKRRSKPHHADRFAALSEGFWRHLVRWLPGFKAEDEAIQLALTRMIFQAPARYRAHSHIEGAAWFSYQELERDFGRGGFGQVNARLGIFEVARDEQGRETWSKGQERTKAYTLTPRVAELHRAFMAGVFRRKPTRLLTEDGNYIESLPASAVEAKDGNGQTRVGFKDLPITPLVPVNLAQLKKLLRDTQARLYAHQLGTFQGELFNALPDYGFLRKLEQEVAGLVHLARNDLARNEQWPGAILTRYTESPSGRLYASGSPNLQNCFRVTRQAAMAGAYDLDIENCHYDILAQMAEKCGYVCTEILAYLHDKEGRRRGMMEQFGITKRQAKDALIALIYGARESKREKDALPKLLGPATQAVYQHPPFKALKDDIAGARKAILAAQDVSRQTICNLRDKTIDIRVANDRQQLAHLLQGVEAAALEAACRVYPERVILLQHDGFSSTTRLDTKRIEEAILAATGYRLKVEQKAITVDLDAAHDEHPADLKNQNEIARRASIHAGFGLSAAS